MNTAARHPPFEESLDDVLDSMPCGFISTLPDGTITQVNATFLSWTDHSRAALLTGKRFQELLTVPGRIFYETHFAPLLRMQGFVKEIACQIKREGREPLQVLISSNVKLGPNGEPAAIRTVIFDATDRVKYEEELRRARSSVQHLAAIVTSSSDAIISIGFDDVVRSWNPGATLLFGYSEEEAVGRTVDELIVPEDMRDVRVENFKKLRSGESVFIKDAMRRRKDGSLAQVEISASSMWDAGGRVAGASLIFRDISERKRAEESLRTAEIRYRTLAEATSTVVWRTTEEGAVVFGSNAWNEVTGQTDEERNGWGWLDAIHPEDRNRTIERWKHSLETRTLHLNEFRVRTRAGDYRWFSVRGVPIFNVDGSVQEWVGANTDIHDEKTGKDALRISEIRYRRLFEAAQDGVLLLDPETRKITDANPFMTALLGYTRDQLVGMELYEIGFLADAQNSQDMFQLLRATRQVRYENLPLQSQDGAVRDVEVVANLYDEDGRAVIQCNVRDITERRQIEAALREKEHFLQQVAHITPGILQVFDIEERRAVFINQSVATLLGYAPEAVLAMGKEVVPSLMHPDDLPRFEQHLARVRTLADSEVSDFEFRMRDREGNWHWFLGHDAVFSRDARGGARQLIGAVSEITARKQAEDAVRTSEARLRLAAKAAGFGVYEHDSITRQSIWSSELFAIMGLEPRERVEMSSLIAAVHTDDRAAYENFLQVPANEQNDGLYEHSYRIVRPNGEIRWVREKGRAEFAGTGENRREIKTRGTIVDISERKHAEDALRQSHDTYLTLIENNPFGVYLIDSDFRMVQVSAGVQEVFGAIGPVIGRDFGEIVRTLWQEPFAGEVIARFRHTLETGERYHSKNFMGTRANRDAEESYDWQIERVTLPHGRFGVVCYFYDMTERKRFEQHIQLLMGEVNHRAKNLLAVVQAIARQTARTGDPATFAILLSERIRGLAASQDLLVKNQWTNVEVSDLVHAQLGHFTDMIGTRVLIEGPPAHLSPGAAQGIGMALHELATNAVKYGALSNARGGIRVYWDIVVAAEPVFAMHWIEEGGPEVVAPARKGFGNRVIERMAEEAVDGKVEVEYRSSGFYWKLTTPSANLVRTMQHER